MKHFLLIAVLFSSIATGFCQPIPDPDSSEPATYHYYYENLGQIVDDTGGQRPEVRYYSDLTLPKVFLADDKISFVSRINTEDTTIADTGYRIDMRFACA